MERTKERGFELVLGLPADEGGISPLMGLTREETDAALEKLTPILKRYNHMEDVMKALVAIEWTPAEWALIMFSLGAHVGRAATSDMIAERLMETIKARSAGNSPSSQFADLIAGAGLTKH